MKTATFVVLTLTILAITGLAGNADFKDEVRAQIAYCENVKAGAMPDYEGIYKTECTPDKLKEFKNILR